MTGTPYDIGILPRCLDVVFNSIRSCQVRSANLSGRTGGNDNCYFSHFQAMKYVFKSDGQNGFYVQSIASAMLEKQNAMVSNLKTPKHPGGFK
jgi:hypothetical protein